jgi:hypothetical protein
MSSIDVPLKNGGFGSTMRKDAWWLEPLLVFLSYMAFIIYANYAILENNYYELPGTGYLSPMYSPLLFRSMPSWWPGFIPYSAAWLILAAGIPLHVLLLSRCVLQSLVGRSNLLRGRRASQELLGRT